MKLTIKKSSCLIIALLYTFLQISTISATQIKQEDIFPPEISAESALLIDAKTGFVIYEKNMDERNFPASTTKIMTALLTIEYAKGNYDERITFSKEAVFGIERGSSHIAMDVGETLTLNQALYAMMLRSANEVSAALAEHIGGSIGKFAEMMTERAKELGANDTNFMNPHGLDNEQHYTTAHDLALIMKECIKHEKFNEVIATKYFEIPPREKQPEVCPLNNTNQLILNGKYRYENIVGGKTGYTDISRHTLVSYAKKGDINMIAVIMKADKNVPYTDSIALYDYGFEIYDNKKILEKDAYSTSLTVYGDEDIKTITLVPKDDVMQYLPKDMDASKIKPELVQDYAVPANIIKGVKAGELNLVYEGSTVTQVDLIASEVLTEALPVSKSNNNSLDKEVFNQMTEPVNGNMDYSGDNADVLKLVLYVLVFAVIFAVAVVIILQVFQNRRINRKIRNFSYRSNGYKLK